MLSFVSRTEPCKMSIHTTVFEVLLIDLRWSWRYLLQFKCIPILNAIFFPIGAI